MLHLVHKSCAARASSRPESQVSVCSTSATFFGNTSINSIYLYQNKNSDILESLAWATAQIHCYRSSTQQDRQKAAATQAIFTAETALSASSQGQGCVVLATDPRILFCDLRLSPGESKSCKTIRIEK